MYISIDSFKKNNIECNWRTLYVGLELHLITNIDITNYAIEFLANHPEINNQDIIQLAWGGDEYDPKDLLENILKDLEDTSSYINFEKRKWRFCILESLKKEYENDIQELLDKVAEVYADFNYPEDMENFVNYLSPKDGYIPSQHTKEENVARLIKFLNDFLKKEHNYLLTICS